MKNLSPKSGAFLVSCVCGLLASAPLQAGNYWHTVTIFNGTGQTAFDLHLNLIPGHPVLGAAHVLPFPPAGVTVGPTGSTIDAVGATVDTGHSAVANWLSGFASDNLDPDNPGYWTDNDHANIGKITKYTSLNLGEGVLNHGGGLYSFGIINSSPDPIAYTEFTMYTGADIAFFNGVDYLAHASSGSLIPTTAAGTLLPGLNPLVGPFLVAPTGYTTFSVKIDGDIWAGAADSVPEPGTLSLFAAALIVGVFAVKFARTA